MPNNGPSSLAAAWYLPLALIVLVAGLYANALHNPFLLEDRQAIVTQPDVIQPAGLERLWFRDHLGGQESGVHLYEPITVLSYHLNAMLTGYQPVALYFRIVNLALLALVGILAARWLMYVVNPVAAWLAAFVLVAHPANAETINHLVGRAELLAVAGVLGFALAQRAALQDGRWPWWRAAAPVLSAIVALGASPTGLLLVPIALVQHWLGPVQQLLAPQRPAPRPWAGTKVEGGKAEISERRGGAKDRHPGPNPGVPRKGEGVNPGAAGNLRGAKNWALFFVAAPILLFALIRLYTVGWVPAHTVGEQDLTANPLMGVSILHRLPAALAVAWFYAGQQLWSLLALPDLLAALVRRPDQPLEALNFSSAYNQVPGVLPGWSSAAPWLGLAMLVLAALALSAAWRKKSWLAVGLTLALGQYFLTGNLLVPDAVYASNRLTLPYSLAACFALAALLGRVTRFSLRRRGVALLPVGVTVAAMAVIIYLGNAQSGADESVRCADQGAQWDNPVAEFHYGCCLLDAALRDPAGGGDKIKNAAVFLKDAVQRRPQSVQALRKLARAYELLGETTLAADQYQAILRLKPGDIAALRALERAPRTPTSPPATSVSQNR